MQLSLRGSRLTVCRHDNCRGLPHQRRKVRHNTPRVRFLDSQPPILTMPSRCFAYTNIHSRTSVAWVCWSFYSDCSGVPTLTSLKMGFFVLLFPALELRTRSSRSRDKQNRRTVLFPLQRSDVSADENVSLSCRQNRARQRAPFRSVLVALSRRLAMSAPKWCRKTSCSSPNPGLGSKVPSTYRCSSRL
jgi:hypothetical protein